MRWMTKLIISSKINFLKEFGAQGLIWTVGYNHYVLYFRLNAALMTRTKFDIEPDLSAHQNCFNPATLRPENRQQ